MRFVDEVKIVVSSGHGGNGCMSFRREKYVPRGGPDGGDGGRGGDIILEATSGKQSLLDFHYRHFFQAKRGQHGRGKDQHGKNGEDLTLLVPVGTVVKDAKTKEVLFDFTKNGEKWIACEGGRGGRGNARFKSATRQAPRFAEEGKEGEERDLVLELKLLADVGLVGFPNAGKSTLISAISAATPKVADYPFTTLVPILGVVRFRDFEPFIVADIPGIVEGAHEGKGIGLRFLKHIERTKVLVYVLDITKLVCGDPLKLLKDIIKELMSFDNKLLEYDQLVLLNKIDIMNKWEEVEKICSEFKKEGYRAFAVSALKRQGLEEFLEALSLLVTKGTKKEKIQPDKTLYHPL